MRCSALDSGSSHRRQGRTTSRFLVGVVFTVSCGLACLVTSGALASPRRATPPRVIAAVGSPPCTTALAAEQPLSGVPIAAEGLPGDTTAVVARGGWSYVAMPDGIEVLSDRRFPPRPVRKIGSPQMGAWGVTVTHNGRYLVVGANTGATVFSVAAATRTGTRPYLGKLSAGPRSSYGAAVVISPDDRFAFVSMEAANEIAVFDLRRALAEHFRTSALVGTIPLGQGPLGMAISPDGRWLYATTEVARGWGGRQPQQGSLSVIDLHRAEIEPSRSVVRTVTAGCRPVRLALSPDGQTIWVVARESNALLAFSSRRLLTDPRRALVADVPVGQAPTDVALVQHDRRLVVTDSNRFHTASSISELTVVDPTPALAGQPALVGSLPAEPAHEEAVETNGTTLLVPELNQLDAINTTYLP